MNKAAIKNFAIWARNKLIADVSYDARLIGITEDGIAKPLPQSFGGTQFFDIGTAEPYSISGEAVRQRDKLIEVIQQKEKDTDYKTAYQYVIEEVAYTWFNRLIAIRFMEVNDYLPSHIRVLSSESGKLEPDLVTTPFDAELPFTAEEEAQIFQLKQDNKLDEVFRILFLKQCNALNEILPALFEKTKNYTELLLSLSVIDQDGVVYHLIHDIPEDDFNIERGGQVEIIGWLYQYYNSELKDDTFALLKKNVKITKERIPSATQLFTPDWIVRYMVENSLGRIYVDKRKNEGIYADGRGADEMTWEESEAKRIANEKYIAEQMGWKYYLPEAEQTEEVRQQLDEIQREYANLDVKDIKIIDPCMGSGHILVYAFDVLMQIYEASGYSQRDAAQSILDNNLYGLDIDDRAAQLAYFAVMMKARQYDRRIFSRGIQPHVYAIVESNGLDSSSVEYFTNNDPKLKKDFGTLIDELRDAKEYGSILNISQVDFAALYARVEEVRVDISIFREIVLNSILPLIQVAEVMAQRYDVVVTNPPYMGSSGMGSKLSNYIQINFPISKADLFSVFIEKCRDMVKKNGYQAMITQQSWMSLPSFLELRKKVCHSNLIVSLLQMGSHSFDEISGEVVASVSFIFRRQYTPRYTGVFFDLQDGMCEQEKEHMYFAGNGRYETNQDMFSLVPNAVMAYEASEKAIAQFDRLPPLKETVIAKPGMQTSDNERFLRFWFEVCHNGIGYHLSHEAASVSEYKWFPYNKGIGFRKWYGNNDYVVNFYHDGEELKYWLVHNPKDPGTKHWSRNMRNYEYYFREGITFTAIGNNFSARLNGAGYLFDTKGPTMFGDHLTYVCGFVNSVVFDYYNRMLCKQITKSGDSVNLVPFYYGDQSQEIENLVESSVSLSQNDWNSYETSWDFICHPLVANQQYAAACHPNEEASPEHYLYAAYQMWLAATERRFQQLKVNEEKLNRLFIDLYGLQDELAPEVEDKDVTVRRADLGRDIRSLISYAVGCMFGRYSLDVDGLAYAGGEWDESRYKTIIPDSDNIIPICDDDYFDDDITGRFVKWVETVYGKETLEENLKFIADALGGKGTPREVIRSYFLNDFYADHLKTYQKRPIYWLFDSGKKNGFKALIYMHRYQSDLLARMRTDYVHEQQERYRTQLTHLADAIEHAGAAERVKLSKQQKKLQEQALEIQKYEEKIHHLADQNIQIDLDDGVKHNYELFADVLAKIK